MVDKMKKKTSIYEERFGLEIKRKKQQYIRWIIIVITVLTIISVLTIGVQIAVRNSIVNLVVVDDLNATWISALASYWGGILGGIISGFLAVVGVAWTIGYYKKSDATKSRAEHMPFLKVQIKGYTTEKYRGGITDGVSLYKINSKVMNTPSKDEKRGEKILFYRIGLKNIGRGFASTTVICEEGRMGGAAFNELIQVNDMGEFCFEIHINEEICGDKINFAIGYIDCMTNEYIQDYCIQWRSKELNDVKIWQGYPCFIGQVHDVG